MHAGRKARFARTHYVSLTLLSDLLQGGRPSCRAGLHPPTHRLSAPKPGCRGWCTNVAIVSRRARAGLANTHINAMSSRQRSPPVGLCRPGADQAKSESARIEN